MASTGAVIVLTAGTATFANKWYQTHQADWKVPIATVIAAAGIDLMAKADNNGATLLSVMVLIGALSTKFNGHSVFDALSGIENKKNIQKGGTQLV